MPSTILHSPILVGSASRILPPMVFLSNSIERSMSSALRAGAIATGSLNLRRVRYHRRAIPASATPSSLGDNRFGNHPNSESFAVPDISRSR